MKASTGRNEDVEICSADGGAGVDWKRWRVLRDNYRTGWCFMIDLNASRYVGSLTLATLIALGSAGCSSLSNTQRGALIGAGAGGALGAAIGNAAGSTAKGVIIGAALGGAAGALIGSRMDDRAETLAKELDGATIERVGEGILVTFDSGILFGFDSSSLRAEARENLGDLARVLNDDGDDYQLLVAGHTDSVGRESYNQSLSERRAQAAADFLTSRGMSSGQVRTRGLGETEPVASNETEAGQDENRRVEVAIYASDDYKDEAIRRAGS